MSKITLVAFAVLLVSLFAFVSADGPASSNLKPELPGDASELGADAAKSGIFAQAISFIVNFFREFYGVIASTLVSMKDKVFGLFHH